MRLVGAKGFIGGWRRRRTEREARKGLQVLVPALEAASASRWQRFVSITPPEMRRFLQLKWQLPPDWNAGIGVPPRPRSVEEMEAVLGTDATQVRALDWLLVDTARDIRRYDPSVFRFLAVPIDAGQEWWDEEYGWAHYPDGSGKPKSQRGRSRDEKVLQQMERVHKIEDREELRRHLLRDHRHEHAQQAGAPYQVFHDSAHIDEAEDSEWDRRLRSNRAE